MKAKKLLALVMSFVMLVSLLPVSALAVEHDFQLDVKLSEDTLAQRDGVSVKVELSCDASSVVGMVMLGLSYDTDVFEAIDSTGALVKLPSDEGKARPKLQVMDRSTMTLLFNTYNNVYAMQVDEDTATLLFNHTNFPDLDSGEADKAFPTATLIDHVFLAFKDGKGIEDVTSESIRYATTEEVIATGQFNQVLAVLTGVVGENNDGDMTEETFSWNYGCKDPSKDTAGVKSHLAVITTNFEFAKEKPVCEAPGMVDAEYGMKLGEIMLPNPTANTPGTWTWDQPNTVIDGIGKKVYTATFTPEDTAAYQTVSGIEVTVNVAPKMLTDVTIKAIDDQTYTGEAITPRVYVMSGGKELDIGSECHVSFENNVNVGKATVIAQSAGGVYDFEEVRTTFNIVAAASEVKITGDISKTYDGKAVSQPEFEVKGSTGKTGVTYFADADCTDAIEPPVNAGTYWVKASVAADNNYGAAEAVVKFTISPADYIFDFAATTDVTVGSAYPESTRAYGMGYTGEKVHGTLTWYLDDGWKKPAAGKVFESVGTVKLYGVFTPDEDQTNFIAKTKNGSTTFNVLALPFQTFKEGFTPTVNKTYGDAAYTRAAALSEGTGAITYSSTDETVATVDAAGKVTIVGAGSTIIVATAAGVEGLWAQTSVSYALNVAKAPVTVTVDPAQRAYGEANPAFAAKAEGLVMNDTIDDLGLGLKTAATEKSNVGAYDVVGDGEYNANYDVTVKGAGALTIVPKTLESVTVADIDDQVYTGEAIEVQLSVRSGDIDLDAGTDFNAVYANNINKGTASITISPVEGSNYTFTTFVKNFEIVAARSVVTVDASALNGVYDGICVGTPDYEVEGSTKNLTITYYTDAECTNKIDAPKAAGTYYVKVSVDADENYGAASGVDEFTISPAPYTFTYDKTAAVYVGKSYPTAAAAEAMGAGEIVKGTLTWYTDSKCTKPTTEANTFATAGKTVTLYWAFTPAAEETNYVTTATKGSTKFTVSALPTQTFADGFTALAERLYGDEAFTRAASLTEGTGAISYRSSDEAVATVNAEGKVTVVGVGTATITATAAEVDKTWAQTSVSYSLKVYQAPVTVTVDAASRPYGEANPVFTAKTEGLVNGDTIDALELGLKSAATAASAVGTYDVVGDGVYNKNYDVTILGEDALTVTPKVLASVSAADIDDQVYTGKEIKPAVSVTAEGAKLVVNKDYTLAYANNTNKGTASITIAPMEGSNYTFTTFVKNFEIVAAKSTVTVDAKALNKTYDALAAGEPAYKVVGSTGEVTFEYYTDAQCTNKIDAPKAAGTYYVKAAVAADENYGAASASAKFTISPADYTYTYTGSTTANVGKSYPATAEASAEGVKGEIVKGELKWYTNSACTKAAEGKFSKVGTTKLYWKFTPEAGQGNYVTKAKTGMVSFAVSALPEQVFADGFTAAAEAVYGGEGFIRTASLTTGSGAITYKSSDETVATVDAAGKVAIVGAGKAVITATAAEVAAEWAETDVSYTLTVAKAPVTVTVDAASRAYGEANPVFTAKAEGLVNGDTIDALELGLKTAATAKSAAGTYDVVGDGAYNSNYDVTILGEGKLTVTKAAWDGSIADQQIRSKFAVTGEKTAAFPAGLPSDKGTTTYALGGVSGEKTIFAADPVVDAATGKVTMNLAGKDAYAEGLTATVAVKVTMENYEDVTVNFVVTLIDKEAPAASAKDITVTYTGSAVAESKISGTATFNGKTLPGTWTFKAGQGLTNVADSGAKTVVFTPADSVNYATVEYTINVTINKAKVTGTPAYTRISEKDKTLVDVALGVGKLTPAGGTIRWVDAQGADLDLATVVTANTSYAWEYTPVDTANYEIATGKLTPYSVGGGGSSASASEVKVEKTENGSVKIDGKAKKGEKVTVEAKPEKGYKVSNVRVYDEKGNEIAVTMAVDGTFTFVMPEGKVRVEADFVLESAELPFTDLAEGAWYTDSVAFVYGEGLMNGTAADTFSPNSKVTRGMIVRILHNLENNPASGAVTFTDVPATAWYSRAVAWAAENGIVTGYNDAEFGPENNITREQLAVILYRYAKFKGYDVSVGENTNILSYNDALEISEYAIPAMQWACGAGLINGISEDTLDPAGNASRGQAAKILMMFCQNVAK